MSPYHILAMDGGGIKGITIAVLLQRLEEAHPGFMAQFDLFAGTSTGGILTVAFGAGMSPTEARILYERCGDDVFADSVLDNIRDIKIGDLPGLIGADYDIEPLYDNLYDQFGDRDLGSLSKRVLVSAFDLDNENPDPIKRGWKAKFFHNYPGEGSDSSEKAVDVAVRTSAAPTFFPIYQGYVDGGVVATNPSMCALAQALHPQGGGQKLDEIVLLSMGTGHNPAYITSQDGDWGLAQWAPHIIGMMLEGGAGLADYQCRQILGNNYFRLDTFLPEPIAMDRVDKVPLLIEIAEQTDLTAVNAWIEEHFD